MSPSSPKNDGGNRHALRVIKFRGQGWSIINGNCEPRVRVGGLFLGWSFPRSSLPIEKIFRYRTIQTFHQGSLVSGFRATLVNSVGVKRPRRRVRIILGLEDIEVPSRSDTEIARFWINRIEAAIRANIEPGDIVS
jgi:hypothetical protein